MANLISERPAAPSQADPRSRPGWPVDWLEGGWALLDATGRVRAVNAALAAWLRRPQERLVGQTLVALLCERVPAWAEPLQAWAGCAEAFSTLALEAVRDGVVHGFTLESARADPSQTVRLNSALPAVTDLAEASWDEYLRSEPAVRQMFARLVRAETQLDALMRRWPGVLFSQRPDFTFQFVSPNIEELTGVGAAAWLQPPQRFWQTVHEADAEEVRRQIQRVAHAAGSNTTTFRLRNVQTGRVAYVRETRTALRSERGLLLGYEGMWLDVTRQTIAEKRLSSAAWKETLAVLTMGLAHDFSNIVAGIHSLSESYLAQIDDRHPFHEGLGLIQQNSMQAGQLSHRLINLHRGRTGERSYQDLNEVVRDAVDLVTKIVPRRIRVTTDFTSEALPLYVDPVELRQVVINLSRNAVDAMPKGGQLCFATTRRPEPPPHDLLEGRPGRWPCACLTVEDTGCGIKPAVLRQIFDPFFTTKSLNEGSGLGLYNARLFVDKHQGAVAVRSAPGAGTAFALLLPEATFQEAEAGGDDPRVPRLNVLVVGAGSKRVESTAEFLRLHGYLVVVATARDKALELLQASEYHFAGVLLVVDANDPQLRGWIDLARQVRPAPQIILQIAGCNQDELDLLLLNQVDLIIAPDTSEGEIVSRLRAVFRARKNGNP